MADKQPIPLVTVPIQPASIASVINWLIGEINNQASNEAKDPVPFGREPPVSTDPTTRPPGDVAAAAVPQTGQMSTPEARETEQKEREEAAQREQHQQQEREREQAQQQRERESGRDRRR